jgi:hypothetical protein
VKMDIELSEGQASTLFNGILPDATNEWIMLFD